MKKRALGILYFLLSSANALCAVNAAQEIPDEARRHAVRGKAAIEGAKSVSDYEEAAAEFSAALKIAPGWGESHYNLAVAQEGANQPSLAIQSLKAYLLAEPDAADAKEVQDKIYALEYREEKAGQEKARTEDIKTSLASGVWNVKDIMSNGQESLFTASASIQLINDQFTCKWDWDNGSGTALTGRLNELNLTGSAIIFVCCPREPMPGTFTGTVSADGRTIDIQVSWPGGRIAANYKLTRQ